MTHCEIIFVFLTFQKHVYHPVLNLLFLLFTTSRKPPECYKIVPVNFEEHFHWTPISSLSVYFEQLGNFPITKLFWHNSRQTFWNKRILKGLVMWFYTLYNKLTESYSKCGEIHSTTHNKKLFIASSSMTNKNILTEWWILSLLTRISHTKVY